MRVRVLVMLVFAVPAAMHAELVTVLFPKGDCSTGHIEVEVFDRETGGWRSHPEHARIATGRCVSLESGVLLNELRVRCVDPGGLAVPSDWVVGAEVFRPGDASECEPPPPG